VGFVLLPEGLSSVPIIASTRQVHELMLITVISANAPDINFLVIVVVFILIINLVIIKLNYLAANINKKNYINKFLIKKVIE
jgi:hypothetical protein